MSNEYIQLDEVSGSIKSPGTEELGYNEKTNLLPLPSSIAVSAEDSRGAHADRLKENRWSSMYALFVHLSQVLGHTNQIHFPHLAGQHGGAAFMIPYFLAYICVGIPILYAEMILAQFSSMPAQYIFRHLSPALAGISIAMFAVNIYRSLYYSALISQLLLLSDVDGLNGKCSKTSNSLLCRDFGDGHFCNAFPPGEVKCSWDSTAELLSSSDQVFAAPHTDYIATNVLKQKGASVIFLQKQIGSKQHKGA
ncbi:sodium:neurotransmitter symporter family domain-containing protein [Ditylenchus destructor]|uniref:Sodium:neurotransmitter symporter family domain-containing protein n=1 Tax=Ditylenchus destructor TaxID=166010 RepID=A0AAD4QVF0_9BILA|nr:sodium:neurotransmitter symporter family domain-containing protein [Ditylenchus destructor]